jgi:hypothetical protein
MKFNAMGKFSRRPFNRNTWQIVIPTITLPDTTVALLPPTLIVTVPTVDLTIGKSVSRNLSDKMAVARVDFDKSTTGGVNSDVHGKRVVLLANDHTGTAQCIFVGEYRPESATYAPAADKETLIAYSYEHYLLNQQPDDTMVVLLAPADQDTTIYKRLPFTPVSDFHIGKVIYGLTSGATAKIMGIPFTRLYSSSGELYQVPSNNLALSYRSTTTFTVGETIKEYGGTGEAVVADVYWDIDFGPTVMYPEDWIESALGGTNNWFNKSGIYPYRMNPVDPISQDPTNVWAVVDPVLQQFKTTQDLLSCIQKFCETHNFIIYCNWQNLPALGGWTQCGYFVHQQDIDNPDDYAFDEHRGLSLPDPVNVTYPDNYLLGDSIRLEIKADQLKNKVKVRCQSVDGLTWYENEDVPEEPAGLATATCSPGVYYGTEKPLVYSDPDTENLSTQAECQDRAEILYAYLSKKISVWTCTFRLRTDFRMLQKLVFSGYGDKIPDGTYRIIGIRPETRAAMTHVTVTIMNDDYFMAQLKINRIYTDPTIERLRTIRNEMRNAPKEVPVIVKAIDGDNVTVLSKDGRIIIAQKGGLT